MLKHILVPLDGSQLAREALSYARQIVDPNGSITLVTIVDTPVLGSYFYYPNVSVPKFEQHSEDLLLLAQNSLEGIARQLNDSKLTITCEVHMGNPAEVICEIAEKHQVSAIAISTQSRSGLNRWLLGSTTNKVLSAKICPVFVVPSGKQQLTEKLGVERSLTRLTSE
jgi:nucleotide-binding universal stress UspA family protein